MALDVVLIVVILVFTGMGLYKGLISAIMGFVSGIAIYISLTNYTSVISAMIHDKIGSSDTWSLIFSILAQLIIICLAVGIIKKLLHIMADTLSLSLANRIFGGIFGLLTANFLIMFLLMFNEIAQYEPMEKIIERSKVCHISNEVNNKIISQKMGIDIYGYLKKMLKQERERMEIEID